MRAASQIRILFGQLFLFSLKKRLFGREGGAVAAAAAKWFITRETQRVRQNGPISAEQVILWAEYKYKTHCSCRERCSWLREREVEVDGSSESMLQRGEGEPRSFPDRKEGEIAFLWASIHFGHTKWQNSSLVPERARWFSRLKLWYCVNWDDTKQNGKDETVFKLSTKSYHVYIVCDWSDWGL